MERAIRPPEKCVFSSAAVRGVPFYTIFARTAAPEFWGVVAAAIFRNVSLCEIQFEAEPTPNLLGNNDFIESTKRRGRGYKLGIS